jgi:MoxR-like ATPase
LYVPGTRAGVQIHQERYEFMPNYISTVYKKIKENIAKVIVGKDDTIDMLLVSMLCGGHILLEDVPGTGKTMLIKSLAASVGCDFKRIQFTPDLLPSDITGVNFFNMKKSEFEFIPGPIFANIVLADEINRATPKTQSGLLECMEEAQATIDGKTYPLASPFMVIATQNPVESMGTFPLPEAQLDRFLMKGSMDYPTHEEGVNILARFDKSSPLATLESVVSAEEMKQAIEELPGIYICRELMGYITSIVEATRSYPRVVLGVSPRGALSLMKAAKGYAAIAGRDYVLPDDIKRAAHPVLEHRLTLENALRIRKNAASEIIDDILSSTAVPTEAVFEAQA